MQVLLLRLDAPLMSFGGPMVDNLGVVQDPPPLSLVTGLLGNALGWEHRDGERLNALQARLLLAGRQDRDGGRLRDFQTVDLGQDSLVDTGWTTRGAPESRGGASSAGTHIRYRDYQVDSVYTLAVGLRDAGGDPSIETLEAALKRPARPLFLGRKACLPAAPIFLRRVDAPSLLAALAGEPPLAGDRGERTVRCWWPAELDLEGVPPEALRSGRRHTVVDERDWVNQIMVGRRDLREATLTLAASEVGHG